MMMKELVSRGNGEQYAWGDGCDGWHLVKTPGMSVIQERMPPGRSETRHLHQHAHQFFFWGIPLAGVTATGCGFWTLARARL
jgi:hypothetical protein